MKTAPDYPIRKAVRASMSLPVALHPCRDTNIHTVVSEHVHELAREMEESGESKIIHNSDKDKKKKKGKKAAEDAGGDGGALEEAPTELYVDGGVLNNYPIDSFDGWWLSMEKEDAFFRRVIGEGGADRLAARPPAHAERSAALADV